jgi:act minimal PKS ketosynthase (KS/KS alpha)
LGEQAYRVPISAVKSMAGQPYAVGGLLGLAAGALALETGRICPTLNLEDPDPECDLDFVPQRSRLNDVATVLVSAMSFGGTHSALLMGRPEQ